MGPVLEVSGVGRSFGELRAVEDVTFEVRPGSRHALIGPNGAGKTTLFNVIAGSLRVTSGRIRLVGDDITRTSEHRRSAKGMSRTFQHSKLFLRETVMENVLLASMRKNGTAANFLRPLRSYGAQAARCADLLAHVGLADRAASVAGALSHGERRQLEVAIALATDPELLLMDEPVAGMSPAETAGFLEVVHALPESVTVLLIEHDLDVVLGLADTVTMLHLGRHLITGTPSEVRASEAAQGAYLGAATDSGRLKSVSGWSADTSSEEPS